jgi:hypothetical protein
MLQNLLIPKIPEDLQNKIISKISFEKEIIEKNKSLIKVFEEKILKVIDQIWES